ncbi:MAG: sigma 54-interacting transcriptional regulator [Desulfobaccales bacterium]
MKNDASKKMAGLGYLEGGLSVDREARPNGPRGSAEMLESINFLRFVLDNVYSGIIVCNEQRQIIFMNQVYAELLRIDPQEAVGQDIKEYFPDSRLSHVLATGIPELGQRCSLKTEALLLVNRIPLKQNGKVVGAILQTVLRDYKDFTDLVRKLNILERKVKRQEMALERIFSPKYTFDSIIGKGKTIKEVKLLALKYARADSPILILGPTGTGKELFAHALHAASNRNLGPFVCLNCAAVPKDLLESELFGYEEGAFTGAKKGGKPGLIELANGGTLYLDEISELSLAAQAKLLRIIEDKVLTKVGGTKSSEIDFRLIAATNRDLQLMIQRGEFRQDLFYRLNTMILNIPPLAKRTEDIPLLIKHFLKAAGRPGCRLNEETQEALAHYHWPGNIRELKNIIERAVSLCEKNELKLEHLPVEVLEAGFQSKLYDLPDNSLGLKMANFEKIVLLNAVKTSQGNMSKTAKLLGISRATLYEKFRKYNLVYSKI